MLMYLMSTWEARGNLKLFFFISNGLSLCLAIFYCEFLFCWILSVGWAGDMERGRLASAESQGCHQLRSASDSQVPACCGSPRLRPPSPHPPCLMEGPRLSLCTWVLTRAFSFRDPRLSCLLALSRFSIPVQIPVSLLTFDISPFLVTAATH